jgi:hypothetical protein
MDARFDGSGYAVIIAQLAKIGLGAQATARAIA